MTGREVFFDAAWIGADTYPVIRKPFSASHVQSATLRIVGFGAYECRINGKRVSDILYAPLNSNFEERHDFPVGEVMAHRIWVDEYDVTNLISEGENVLCVLLGDGWYTGVPYEQPFGERKVCFVLTLSDGVHTERVVSSLKDRYVPSPLKSMIPFQHETYDYTAFDEQVYLPGYTGESMPVRPMEEPQSDYGFIECPRDRVCAKLTPRMVHSAPKDTLYDAGENISGFPVLRAKRAGEVIHITYSEELKDGELDPSYLHLQQLTFTSDSSERILFSLFSWFGFRYFRVEGDAEVLYVAKVHTDVAVTASFETDNETLNWIYRTFLNTQLCNMHAGIPSDCPHLERRGYTGDGQLCCGSVMRTLDVQTFYRKWLYDIADCQDRVTGHVQYTAPYTRSGGGPGGWGGAIVFVPYRYYLEYGDEGPMREMYSQMLRYFDFLDTFAQDGLIVRDYPADVWCLGEWCTPDPIRIPAPYVNGYFYIKALQTVRRIAQIIGKNDDIPAIDARMKAQKRIVCDHFFDPATGDFAGNIQGADVFAWDMGLGDERTVANAVSHYEKEPYFDTGIFGTPLVVRMLFSQNRPDLAWRVLTAKEPHGFAKWMEMGATTFHEEWYTARSHSHPMFGAVVDEIFSYIAGIRQAPGSVAYSSVIIDPAFIDGLDRFNAGVTSVHGEIRVSYETNEQGRVLTVTVPRDMNVTVLQPAEIVRV